MIESQICLILELVGAPFIRPSAFKSAFFWLGAPSETDRWSGKATAQNQSCDDIKSSDIRESRVVKKISWSILSC